jgi:alpha-D-xyloside xylohydrolase
MHGHRDPITEPEIPYRDGIAQCNTGAGNELWSFGESTFAILHRYAVLREKLRPYLRSLMQQAHETGEPLMRPLFYHYPEDEQAWQITDQYLFGEDVLVAPVVNAGDRQRSLWLPGNTVWVDAATGERHEGGRTICVDAPLAQLPLFVREDADVLTLVREALRSAE